MKANGMETKFEQDAESFQEKIKALLKNKTQNLRGDFFGGITAGVVTLPLALAFGVQSGLGATAGLYCAIALGLLSAIFGGTQTLISTPTGPMTVVSALIIAKVIEQTGSLAAGLGLIIAIFVLAGLLQVLLGVFRIGSFIQYMPYPVISGFMTGIGVILIIVELFPFMGLESPKNVLAVLNEFPAAIPNANFSAVVLAAVTMAIIYLFPRVSKAVPSTLVALIIGTLATALMGLSVPIIGDIPKGLPSLKLDELTGIDVSHLPMILIPALTLAGLGAIDTLLTSVIADTKTRTQHDSNRELIGQGCGNMLSGALGGIVGAGTTMSTLVNINTGGRTNLSGMISASFLLMVLLGLGAYAQYIPIPVLAGILMTVGLDIIDYKGLKHLAAMPRSASFVLVTVFLLTVFVDLIEAVAVGMGISCVVFMKTMSDIGRKQTSLAPLNDLKLDFNGNGDNGHFHSLAEVSEQIYVKTVTGPIFFGFARTLTQKIRGLKNTRCVILDMDRVPYIDQTGLFAMEDMVRELNDQGIEVLMAGAKNQPLEMLKKMKMVPNVISPENLFASTYECLHSLGQRLTPVSDQTR
ncbi:SulP family inorganic anion transporter [Nitrospina gracilis]|uniref:SulP family inorganic anion transporter n=1 Tax=Nitrospina gracilis TaxID=35801 RepID=UPI001F1D9898|nr:SulP family inorganic anion transporter [Nitrospina gracilis]MCF8719576.1 SulP family sulfate permease [Nitrospina gracilis Nb-211]